MMNANQMSLVRNVMNVKQITTIILYVKVSLKGKVFFFKIQPYSRVSECNCDPDGSISLQCDNNGDCTCKTYSIGSKCNASCNDKLSWVGDNQCDDETNHAGCNFDGGDCCGDNINTNFCIECNCKHQSACGKGFQGWVGDGYCDDLTNNAGCNYDGGDCCGDDINTEYCSLCSCRNNGTTIQD